MFILRTVSAKIFVLDTSTLVSAWPMPYATWVKSQRRNCSRWTTTSTLDPYLVCSTTYNVRSTIPAVSWCFRLVEESTRQGDKQGVHQRQEAGSEWDRESDPWQGNTYALRCRVGDVGDAVNSEETSILSKVWQDDEYCRRGTQVQGNAQQLVFNWLESKRASLGQRHLSE